MPEFADNRTYSQNFHEGQLRHYAINNGEVPRMGEPRQRVGESRGRMPERRPVGSASRQHQQSMSPSAPQSRAPSRKPVGGSRTQSPASSRTQSPASSNRHPNPDLNKALPRIPKGESIPFIGRDPIGRFNVHARTPEGSVPQSPIGGAPRHQIPGPAKALLQSPAGSVPASPRGRPEPTRPGSSGGWSFMGRKRRDSNASNQSGAFSRQGSRRGSLSEAAKSAGKWAKDKADIVVMNKTERDAFIAGAQKAHDREVEEARKKNPSSRPVHQQKYIVAKQQAAKPGESWGAGPPGASYEALVEERVFRERTSAGYKRMHDQACATALLEGRSRPETPNADNWTPPAGSLNSEERDQAMHEAEERERASQRIEFGFGDRFAFQLSKMLDGVKRERQASDSSDMDFGMTDSAPLDAMYVCGKQPGPNFGKGCQMPSSTFLKGGLCDKCHAYQKHRDLGTAPIPARQKGHNPRSPEDDIGGDLYIKLPEQHRLRMVRQTVYGDLGGNPFASDALELSTLSSNRYQTTVDDDTNNTHAWEQWELQDTEGMHDSQRTKSDPFDLVGTPSSQDSQSSSTILGDMSFSRALNRETLQSSASSDRRSMSVDIFLSGRNRKRDSHQSDEQSFLHFQHPSGTLFTENTKRNTNFYDFYDSILADQQSTMPFEQRTNALFMLELTPSPLPVMPMKFQNVRTHLRSKMQAITLPWNKSTEKSDTATSSDILASSHTFESIPVPIANVLLESWDMFDWKYSSDALCNWYNSRILKTGYSVSREMVYHTLKMYGREAHMDLGDHLQGAFFRKEI
ncbi:hypothetical protein Q7P37_002657 [Cladosporium fusiforme]